MYDYSRQRTFEDTCEPCRPGYYGNHPERKECRMCRAGVVCHATATTDVPLFNETLFGYNYTKSFPCPVGKFSNMNQGNVHSTKDIFFHFSSVVGCFKIDNVISTYWF